MNRSIGLLLAGWLGMLPGWVIADVKLPTGSSGEVTLDWQKFNEIWTRMQKLEKQVEDLKKPEHKPPVPFTITKAAYKGNVEKNRVNMSAAFEIDVYEPKEWVKIPFLPSSIAITEARLNGEPIGVVQENNSHQIVLKRSGRHILRVNFALKAPKAEEAPQLNFNILETPMTVVALEFPKPQLDVTIEPSQGVDTRSVGNERTVVTAALPPTSYINVRWQKATTEETAGPAKLYLDNQQLITVAEGTIKSRWMLNYSILHRGVRQILLQPPANWNILAVTCDGMQEWKIVEGSKGPQLMIQLAYARRGALSVMVDAEKGLGEKDDVIEIPRLVPLNIEREQGTVGVEAKGAVELQVQTTTALHRIDPKELPGALWQAAAQPILFAFRYTKPYSLALAVTHRPEVPVLSTTIDDANGITVLTPRGQQITKVRYQVRNQLKQYLAVTLPKEAELWSAFVAGEPVKPTRAEDGSYRIPLAKSQLEQGGQQGFPVELIYYRHVPKFIPVGYRAMTLPMPDAPVSRMMWSLYLPEKYRFPYFGGDVEKGAMANPISGFFGQPNIRREDMAAPNMIQPASARMKQNRDAMKELAYRVFNAKKAGAASGMGSDEEMDQLISRQSEMAADLFDKKDKTATVAGIYPVSFELPASGQLFHFGQVMIVGQDPTVSMFFLHERIVQGILLMMLVLLGMMLFKRRAAIYHLFQVNLARIRALRPTAIEAQ